MLCEAIPDPRDYEEEIIENEQREETEAEIRRAVSELPENERRAIEKVFFKDGRPRNLSKEDQKAYTKARTRLQKDRRLRALIYEDDIISRAYNWHYEAESCTEWSALKLIERQEGKENRQ